MQRFWRGECADRERGGEAGERPVGEPRREGGDERWVGERGGDERWIGGLNVV